MKWLIRKCIQSGILYDSNSSNYSVWFCSADVPNAGRGLVTLPKRMKWDPDLRNYVKELDAKKPVILCGDMNVSHQPIGR
jgi:exonuclease III